MIYLYKRKKKINLKQYILKTFALLFLVGGLSSISVVAKPFLDLQLGYGQVLGQEALNIPIPKTKVVAQSQFPNIFANSIVNLSGVDYTNARNWFPENDYREGPYSKEYQNTQNVSTYSLTIPKLKIEKAVVSVSNDDLSQNLFHYGGSGIPGKAGNAVVFGHSTLPQLFNPKNYKTIFATLHTLTTGDEVFLDYDGVIYKYAIVSRLVVDPSDTSVLSQQYDDSYLTIITCTPPGTYWKRLILKAKIEKIS